MPNAGLIGRVSNPYADPDAIRANQALGIQAGQSAGQSFLSGQRVGLARKQYGLQEKQQQLEMRNGLIAAIEKARADGIDTTNLEEVLRQFDSTFAGSSEMGRLAGQGRTAEQRAGAVAGATARAQRKPLWRIGAEKIAEGVGEGIGSIGKGIMKRFDPSERLKGMKMWAETQKLLAEAKTEGMSDKERSAREKAIAYAKEAGKIEAQLAHGGLTPEEEAAAKAYQISLRNAIEAEWAGLADEEGGLENEITRTKKAFDDLLAKRRGTTATGTDWMTAPLTDVATAAKNGDVEAQRALMKRAGR